MWGAVLWNSCMHLWNYIQLKIVPLFWNTSYICKHIIMIIYNNILYVHNRWYNKKIFRKIIGEFHFCNLSHTCTPNVSPHVPGTVYNKSFAIVNCSRDTLQYCKLSQGHFRAGDSTGHVQSYLYMYMKKHSISYQSQVFRPRSISWYKVHGHMCMCNYWQF